MNTIKLFILAFLLCFSFSKSEVNESAGTTTIGDNPANFWYFHGITLTLIWTGLNFIGYIFARFFKHLTWWIWMHFIFSGITGLLSIGILAVSIKYNYYLTDVASLEPHISVHIYFGFIFFALVILQTALGVITYFCIYQRKVFNSDFIHKFKIVHRILGIILTFIVYIAIFTGFFFGEWKSYMAIPAVFCVLFLGTIIILEIYFFIQNCYKKVGMIKQHFNEVPKYPYINLIQLNEEKKTKKFVLYENYVCDVGNFIDHHPGGAFMIRDNLYSDVGRYLTGTQAYSRYFKDYDHLLTTHTHLTSRMCYAQLKDNHGIIKKEREILDTENVNINEAEYEPVYVNENSITISERTEIAEDTHAYTFTFSSKFKFTRLQEGVFWIGRHFALSSDILNRTRYYTLSLSLDQDIKRKHLMLLENVYRIERGEDQIEEGVVLKECEKYSDTFKLYIKRYRNKNALSDYIFNFPLNKQSDLILRGPSGIGLNLFDNRLIGTNVILAAGTGVIPFLDLVAFTLRYAVYKVSIKEEQQRNIKQILLNEKDSFEKIVSDNFKLKMFVSFANPNVAKYIDLCDELEKFDKHFNLNLFSLHKTFFSENKELWDENFLKRNLLSFQLEINKVYIVGPVGFMDSIKRDLLASEMVSKEQIILI